MSLGGVRDVRQSSLLSIGIFEGNTEPEFLFLDIQPAEPAEERKIETLLYEFSQSNRLVYLFLGFEMFVVYFPSSCEPQVTPSEVTQVALSNSLRIRPWKSYL